MSAHTPSFCPIVGLTEHKQHNTDSAPTSSSAGMHVAIHIYTELLPHSPCVVT